MQTDSKTFVHSAKDIKHKISFLLQKPEPQAADQREIKEKSATAAAKRSGKFLLLFLKERLMINIQTLMKL